MEKKKRIEKIGMISSKEISKKEALECFLEEKGIDPYSKQPFRCLFPDHEDRHPSMGYDRKRGRVHCFACGRSADVYDLLALEKGLNYPSALRYAFESWPSCRIGKDAVHNEEEEIEKEDREDPEERERKRQGLEEKLLACCQDLSDDAISYLEDRGLTLETIFMARIGQDLFEKGQPLVFPYGPAMDYWAMRRIDGNMHRWSKPSVELAGPEPLYNGHLFEQALEDPEDIPVITEGIFDALAIGQESSLHAAALCGTGWRRLVDRLPEDGRGRDLWICLDNDGPGRKAAAALQAELSEKNWRAAIIQAGVPCKDASEFLEKDPKGFRGWLRMLEKERRDTVEKRKRPASIAFLAEKQPADKERMQWRTGSRMIDEAFPLYAGLVVLGAMPSAGKTTLALQAAWQMAKEHHCLFFSLEMSRSALVEKIVSMQMAEDPRLSYADALQKIREDDRRLSVYELAGSPSVGQIQKTARDYARANGCRPAVFIDYLQVMGGDGPDTRSRIDRIVGECRAMARSSGWLVVLVSAFSRANYYRPADLGSFKESGGIEYAADMVLGLQYRCLHDPLFNSEGDHQKKRDRIQKERMRPVRAMEMVCLKNRTGPAGQGVMLDFDAAHSFFRLAGKPEKQAGEERL